MHTRTLETATSCALRAWDDDNPANHTKCLSATLTEESNIER